MDCFSYLDQISGAMYCPLETRNQSLVVDLQVLPIFRRVVIPRRPCKGKSSIYFIGQKRRPPIWSGYILPSPKEDPLPLFHCEESLQQLLAVIPGRLCGINLTGGWPATISMWIFTHFLMKKLRSYGWRTPFWGSGSLLGPQTQGPHIGHQLLQPSDRSAGTQSQEEQNKGSAPPYHHRWVLSPFLYWGKHRGEMF